MDIHIKFLLVSLICFIGSLNAAPTKEPKQTWGFVDVRSDAHMFWWLYYTTADVGYRSKPLVIWLQGGPGGSSAGFGNFGELGPLDVKLQPRDTTWVSEASVLFIDNPVGAGYSYVTSDDAYTTDVSQIAKDLVQLMSAFMDKLPDFQTIPLWVFCESYGGKMTSAFAQALNDAATQGKIHANLKGIALGDSWISPLDYTNTWGPYLYATSLVDFESLEKINKTAVACQDAYNAGNYTGSTALWSQEEDVINNLTGGVNFYNILKWNAPEMEKNAGLSPIEKLYNRHVKPMQNDELSDLMNGPIRKKIGIIPNNVTWGAQSGMVFQKQSGDFMKPVVDIVDDLLANTNLSVVVYNGQLDLICDTMGTELWVQRLKWSGLPSYNKQTRHQLVLSDNNTPWGYIKEFQPFTFFWILDAGHMVPADAGKAALKMLQIVINRQ